MNASDFHPDLYQALLRPLLFSGMIGDPEQLHHRAIDLLQWLDRDRGFVQPRLRHFLRQTCCFENAMLQQTLWGLNFANPIGLAAGFDKDGVASGIWSELGFGFAELGTVTGHPQPGNSQPRLFRLPHDQAILNRMGFNNQGAAALAERLQSRQSAARCSSIPLGINLGKSQVTPLEEAAADYGASFRLLQNQGDYFVINVSSPNTPGLRSLQATEQLEPILSALQAENQSQKPLLIKIAPDLEWEAIESVLALAQQHQLAGIIATNTTIRRDQLQTERLSATGKLLTDEAGGISGKPVRDRSTEIIRFIYRQTQGSLPIIGVGGVFSAADAWEKITAGASLVQVYTGWVYEGPWMVKRILTGLAEKLQTEGIASLKEAIGVAAEGQSVHSSVSFSMSENV
ncbi:quinone-dependent dihydroorotate dehydrogenase [Leptolyngbya sp. FACHB-711]|uniref:quinone-dependent dihydroorotate dehydrogenase n=1 Tax=Leptolyngbya sp. FACHB-711 TaxID=2692813 RepID=UPI0024114C8D|nr:quinone-dependent dihydroorotate dehydrogenase [Leptolyngbya sp. FACHB-711]